MPWSPPAFTGAVIWQDEPSHNTPLDSANLAIMQANQAAYADSVGQSVVNYIDPVVSVIREAPLNLMDPRLTVPAANDGTTDDSAALVGAHALLPTTGGEIYMPGGTGYVLENVALTKDMTLRGDADTLLIPGPSTKQILTHSANSKKGMVLKDVSLVSRYNDPNTADYDYSKPLLDIQSIAPRLRNVFGRITGTGTLIKFHQNAYDASILADSQLYAGHYGVAVEYINDSGSINDTIAFRDNLVKAAWGCIITNPAAALSTVQFDQWKQVSIGPDSGGSSVLLVDSLNADAHATDTTIVVTNGALWNINDSVMIEGSFTHDSSRRLGQDVEVNKITGVAGNTLSLKWPLRYDHTTNGGSYTVQVLRGGVGITLPQALTLLSVTNSHFEGTGWGMMTAANIINVALDGIDMLCPRLLRIAGFVNTLRLGRIRTFGKSITMTGDLHSNTTINNLPTAASVSPNINSIWSGAAVVVTGSGIPANTTVVPPPNYAGGSLTITNSATTGSAGVSLTFSEGVVVDIPSYADPTPIQGAMVSFDRNTGGTGSAPVTVNRLGTTSFAASFIDLFKPTPFTKAGIPTDSDFLGPPSDGQVVTDTTNGLLHRRSSGAWTATTSSPVDTGSILLPIAGGGVPVPTTPAAIGTSFKAFFQRTIAPRTGTLVDIAVWNGGTVAGNINVAVFDCGEALAGSYTPLWSSGSVAATGGASAWQHNFGSPNLSLYAGQHVMLAVMNDGTTWTPGRFPSVTNVGVQTMPSTAWLPAQGGNNPKLIATNTFGSLVYSAVTEANMVTATAGVFIMGRLS